MQQKNKKLQKGINRMRAFLNKVQKNNSQILDIQRERSVLFVKAQYSSTIFHQLSDKLGHRNDELENKYKESMKI